MASRSLLLLVGAGAVSVVFSSQVPALLREASVGGIYKPEGSKCLHDHSQCPLPCFRDSGSPTKDLTSDSRSASLDLGLPCPAGTHGDSQAGWLSLLPTPLPGGTGKPLGHHVPGSQEGTLLRCEQFALGWSSEEAREAPGGAGSRGAVGEVQSVPGTKAEMRTAAAGHVVPG